MKRIERAKMLLANAAFARSGLADAMNLATDPAEKARLRGELEGKNEECLMYNDLVGYYQRLSYGAAPEEIKGG